MEAHIIRLFGHKSQSHFCCRDLGCECRDGEFHLVHLLRRPDGRAQGKGRDVRQGPRGRLGKCNSSRRSVRVEASVSLSQPEITTIMIYRPPCGSAAKHCVVVCAAETRGLLDDAASTPMREMPGLDVSTMIYICTMVRSTWEVVLEHSTDAPVSSADLSWPQNTLFRGNCGYIRTQREPPCTSL